METFKKIKRLIVISRPLSWPAGTFFYLLGVGHISNFTAYNLLEIVFLTFPLSLFIFGLNDIYDFKSDQLNERKGTFQGAVLTQSEAKKLKKYIFLLPIPILLIALLSLNPVHITLAIIGIFICFAYSAPPFRLKTKPLLDSLSNGVGAVVTILLGFSTHSNILEMNPYLYSVIFPIMGIHALTALLDVECDKKSGFNTIATLLGKNKLLLFSALMFGLPMFFIERTSFLIFITIASILATLLGIFVKKYFFISRILLPLVIILTTTFLGTLSVYFIGTFF